MRLGGPSACAIGITWCAMLLLAGAGACVGPGGASFRMRPGTAELRGSHYSDNSGLTVASLAANVEQPVSQQLTATVRGVADHVVVARTIVEVPPALLGNQLTGHADTHPDVVTSASTSVTGGEGSDKWRFEAAPGLRWQGDVAGADSSAALQFRISSEPDYTSKLALLRAASSLLEGNTTLVLFTGYGTDTVTPRVPPPGQDDAWPASHQRVIAGASISQLLSPELVLSAGASATFQRGTLSNPYRRATIRTSLFPEVLPRRRDRFTAFIASSWHMGWDAALHGRLGFYTDSWHVSSAIPELAFSKELGPRFLLELGYRFYKQTAADFYRPVYDEREAIVAGDMRLGRTHEHMFGSELQWMIAGRRDDFGALKATARFQLSLLRYDQLPTDMIVGRIIQLAVLGSY
jgi:hypothetical protein